MVYAYKQARGIPVPAGVAGSELSRIRAEQGRFFAPAAVVHASRPEDAPLHPVFEWDDRKAAAAHREEQAKYLIRNVLVVNPEKPEQQPMRAFVSVELEGEGHRYTTVAHAMSVPDLREQVLAQAQADMQAFARKYQRFMDLSEVARAFERAHVKAGAKTPVLAKAS